jgi:hypothetical protein
MTKKELIERLKEVPDDWEIFIKPDRLVRYKSEYQQPLHTTNIIVDIAPEYMKRVYLK